MRYLALATDYDGTLANEGRVPASALRALENFKKTGRRLLLVTGRELPDLSQVFTRFDLFDLVVAENGALLFHPSTQNETVLASAPPAVFVEELQRRAVPFRIGRSVLSTHASFAELTLQAIQSTGAEMQVIFNKGALMVLPSGINKATGLQSALEQLRVSPHNVVAIGDAENDHALLSSCEFGVAVSNAVPLLKERADWVTQAARAQGVEELVERIIDDDLSSFDEKLRRHRLAIGKQLAQGKDLFVSQSRGSILIAGPSGSGKSTMTMALIEQMIEQKYQFCIVDPEGDYGELPGVIVLGSPSEIPSITEVERILENPSHSVALNLLAIPVADRPLFFAGLFPRLTHLRTAFGRPHWIFVDEAHHLLPSSWHQATSVVPQELGGLVLITVHPLSVASVALHSIDTVIAIGKDWRQTLTDFSQASGHAIPKILPSEEPGAGQSVVWVTLDKSPPLLVKNAKSKFEQRRHIRKYAQGKLPEDRSFYFRGPHGKLNLRAHNLTMFIALADGVDDETWTYHLRQGDFSSWVREAIKDDDLAAEIANIEHETADPKLLREKIKQAIEHRYTAAA